jgi:hypothetical protein
MLRATLFLLAAILVVARPIAFSSPPDPTWLVGVYDAADGDDAVIQAMDRVGSDRVAIAGVAAPARLCQAPVIGAQRNHGHRPPPMGGRAPPGKPGTASC